MTRYYTARDALDVGRALTGLADTLIPDLAYLNEPDAPTLDAVHNRDASAYVNELLTEAATVTGDAALTRWEQVDEFQHEITIEGGSGHITYRGVIPAGINPVRLYALVTATWTVVKREKNQTNPDDYEDF